MKNLLLKLTILVPSKLYTLNDLNDKEMSKY